MGERTVQDIYDSMSEEQKRVLHRMAAYAADTGINVFTVYDGMSEEQRVLVKNMVAECAKYT